MKIFCALFAGTLCQTLEASTKSNPVVLTGTCLAYSQGQGCRKLAAWHVYKGEKLVEKIKKTENIDRFETDVVDALDSSKLGRLFRKDQTKILFGDVVDGELVLSPEVTNVYSKSLETVTDIIRMESYNTKDIFELESEPVASPPTPEPTENVISIEPEFDSEISDSEINEDTVIPEVSFDASTCEFYESSFYAKCSCARPLVVNQKFVAQGFGEGCEEITKEIEITCFDTCFQLEIIEESASESSGDFEIEIGSGEILDDDEGGDDDDWSSSSRAESPSIEYEEDIYYQKTI